MRPVLLQPAFILHRRSYRETSFLLEIFSEEHGRFTAIAKGVRKSKSDWQGLLQPFFPLMLSFRGKAEIMTLTHVEASGTAFFQPTGENLYVGFYLNELLIALLQKWDPHPHLYTLYAEVIKELKQTIREQALRRFELSLLRELGYGLFPEDESELKKIFQLDQYYHFFPGEGFRKTQTASASLFLGKNLTAIAKEDWYDESILKDAKRLTRAAIQFLLGTRELNSRKLFTQPLPGKNDDANH